MSHLNETQVQRIREEAETAYPGEAPIPFLERGAYIKAATLYQERINGLVEALEHIAGMHPDGNPVNFIYYARKILDTYNKTINNG